jgi:hypothetical protein
MKKDVLGDAYITYLGDEKYTDLFGKYKEKKPLGRPRRR